MIKSVNELQAFTKAELATIADALKVAAAHYRMLAEVTARHADYRLLFDDQARDATDLQLKIEVGQ
jgi:hypothetical protein